MSKAKYGLVAAMETESVIPQLEDTEKINFDAAKKKDTEADIKVCEESIQALETIKNTMDASLKTGGLDTSASEIMYITLEEIYTRAKVSKVGVVPALESFHAPAIRIGSTKNAIESIDGKIGEIKERIAALKS